MEPAMPLRSTHLRAVLKHLCVINFIRWFNDWSALHSGAGALSNVISWTQHTASQHYYVHAYTQGAVRRKSYKVCH